MSYLKLPGGLPDFSKAVFSLWFRAPSESVFAASSHSIDTGAPGWAMLQNTIPLITFGRPQQNKNLTLLNIDVAHGDPQGNVEVITPVAWAPAPEGPIDVDPCYIGLLCEKDGTFQVDITIQMGNEGSYSGLIWFTTDMSYIPNYNKEPPLGSGIIGQWYQSEIVDGTDGSTNAQPELFYISTTPKLDPDKWHHLLLSFDVGGGLSAGDFPTSACKLWYAIDDQDFRGWENLGPYRDEDDTLNENAILTRNIWRSYGPQTEFIYSNYYIPHFSASYSPAPIPSSGAELGIPAASKYVDGIFRVEMAEFQMWTGVTLDTGSTGNRRAFVDAKGKPVDPTGTEEEPAPAEMLLGKKPEIMLHGNSKWQAGKNTGTLGVEIGTDGAERELPGGQFTPVAGIEKYKPEPALTETPTD